MRSIIIRGPLGVGKSTVAKVIAEKIGVIYVSVDEILAQHGLDKAVEGEGISLSNFLKANEFIVAEAQRANDQGKSVIIDGNFYHKEQIDQLVHLLEDNAVVFTLKASVETCIARDAARAKPYGEDATRAVHMLVSAFDYGTVIDIERQNMQEIVQSLLETFDSPLTMIDMITFRELANKITNLPHKHRQRLIAIDGGGGAGKTTFASCLQNRIPGSHIVKIDDFYRPPQLRTPLLSITEINPNFDWNRLRTLVLDAVTNDKDISYQLYDFENGTLTGEVIVVPRAAIIILEGVWSMQREFVDFYDYCIWLEAPANMRLERGVSRDGEEFREVWEREWIPIDESYKKLQEPHRRADLIVDGARSDFQKDHIVILMNSEEKLVDSTRFDWNSVGLDFGNWEEEKIWALDLPIQEIDIENLLWHLDVPYWENDTFERWTVTPRDVIDGKNGTTHERIGTDNADASFPIDLFEHKGKIFVLDGLHRFIKLFMQGKRKIRVRIIPKDRFSEIASEHPIELPTVE